MADTTDAIRFYDRALARLTRRELLNVVWGSARRRSQRLELASF